MAMKWLSMCMGVQVGQHQENVGVGGMWEGGCVEVLVGGCVCMTECRRHACQHDDWGCEAVGCSGGHGACRHTCGHVHMVCGMGGVGMLCVCVHRWNKGVRHGQAVMSVWVGVASCGQCTMGWGLDKEGQVRVWDLWSSWIEDFTWSEEQPEAMWCDHFVPCMTECEQADVGVRNKIKIESKSRKWLEAIPKTYQEFPKSHLQKQSPKYCQTVRVSEILENWEKF